MKTATKIQGFNTSLTLQTQKTYQMECKTSRFQFRVNAMFSDPHLRFFYI
jgi:hypothetical protein